MYYGYYSNHTLHRRCRPDDGGQNMSSTSSPSCPFTHLSYNLPLAYFFTIGMALFFTCIILVYRYS